MVVDRVVGYAFLASLLLNIGLGVGVYAQRAHVRELKAEIAPLKQAVQDADRINEKYRTALQTCENEKVRLRKLTIDAWEWAAKQRDAADKGNEDFQHKLAQNPKDCAAILEAQVCPLLMDY